MIKKDADSLHVSESHAVTMIKFLCVLLAVLGASAAAVDGSGECAAADAAVRVLLLAAGAGAGGAGGVESELEELGRAVRLATEHVNNRSSCYLNVTEEYVQVSVAAWLLMQQPSILLGRQQACIASYPAYIA